MSINLALGKAREAARGAAWLFKGVMGENAYQAYLDHQTRTHVAEAPMTEREFWRDKTDRQDANPEGRCC
ncbi:YbdD/YjiX family protein [Arthrobacter sp. Br18]|uniref:YbdD/YjiX family protein n=1 Tax=Arthrobacter sp. Br18 TaxID=1312954 RepID=UPI00047A0DF2|nr:YbdD/YjiX family protein [Arthrobacter sp. Br18]